MPSPLHCASLEEALAVKGTILTPNQRLSRALVEAHAQQQRQNGITAWPTAAIFSLENWIKHCWQQLQELGDPLGEAWLLDSRQELQLWQTALDQDVETRDWLQPAGAARQAQQAFKTLQLWRQHPLSEQLQPYIDDQYSLDRWHQSFRLLAQPLQAISFGDACERLIKAFTGHVLKPAPCCCLNGFQDIPPLYQSLLDAAFSEQRTLNTESRQDKPSTEHCQRLGCDSTEHEIRQAAQWTRQILQRVPGARIAVVDPELSTRRDLHERIFRQHLEPHRLFDSQPVDAPLFNISVGVPLAQCPVIDSALLLLRLVTRPLQLDDLAALLYSPFFAGSDDELSLRVELEQQLRRLGLTELSLSLIQQQLQRLISRQQLTPAAVAEPKSEPKPEPQQARFSFDLEPTQQASESLSETQSTAEELNDSPSTGTLSSPGIETLLEQLIALQRQPKRTPSNWGRWTVTTLQQLGWPGQRRVSSLEYQQISLWYQLLAGLGRFDAIHPALNFNDGLRLLRNETQSTVFQPQTPNSAVQILGPLEAAGLEFSHLWLMGLSDERWPAPSNLNPLLPAAYQQAMKMPHASAERELSFASQLTQLFSGSADHVVFSHPLRQDDQQLRPSTLITKYPDTAPDQLVLSNTQQTQSLRYCSEKALLHPVERQQQVRFEPVDTATAPAIGEMEKQQLRGGSAILTNQSSCPFSAFAIHRLGARSLDTPDTGLSHADRGNLLHDLLEQIWLQLHSQQQLLDTDPKVLAKLIGDAIDKITVPYRRRAPRWMGDRFWQLEQQRLHTLADRWLGLERQRPPFRVAAVEKSLNTELLGMPMQLRIDRVDRLADGSELLIDYKTGNPSVSDWFGERPRQPQLPLYLWSSHHQVSALAFGQINATEVCFKGVCDETVDLAPTVGINPLSRYRNAPSQQWLQIGEQWQQTLERLMGDFLNGIVSVSPLDANAYQYSKLQPLNRFYEIDQLGTSAADDPSLPSPFQGDHNV
ncbi:MAG: PD-(D/E)XK nuclease family protein [Motiliproteus sp.]